jgi:VPDSG-CTERM motif
MLAFGNNAQALTFGDGNDLGQVLFGIPSGDQDRTDYVNHLISLATGTVGDSFQGQTFNRTSNSCGTCPTVNVANITNGTGIGINLGSGGSLYLFAKYDGKNAGSEVWNIQGLTGVITIPAQGLQADIDAGHAYGLSGWSIWGGTPTSTPDGGATAALLGLGLAGLAGLRARFGRH